MKKYTTSLLAIAGMILSATLPARALIVDFTDLNLPADSYRNTPAFTSNGAGFNNTYDSQYGSWGGFAYSNKTDTTTAGYGNQYSSITGTNGNGLAGGIYAVAYQDFYTPTIPRITLPIGYAEPVSITLTNTTYTYLAIRDGDAFSNQFIEGDWFKIAINAYSAASAPLGSLDFYLADYRSAVPAERYIVSSWTDVDLSSFGTGVSYLTFEFDSSDAGFFGINTPTFVAVGKLTAIPEPSTAGMALLAAAGSLGGWACGIFRRREAGKPRAA